jgi:hypothetical protein
MKLPTLVISKRSRTLAFCPTRSRWKRTSSKSSKTPVPPPEDCVCRTWVPPGETPRCL